MFIIKDNISFHQSLSFKIISIVGIILILALGAMIYFTTQVITEETNSLSENRNLISTEYVKSEIEGFLEFNEGIIATFSNNNLFSASNINTEMSQNELAEIQKGNDQFKNVYFGSRDGEMIIAPSQELPADYDPRDRSWYKNAVEKNEIIWTNIYEDAASGVLMISVAIPIENNGQLKGVVAGDITLDYLSEIVSNFSIGENGFAFITNNQGNLLAHPNQEILNENPNMFERFNTDAYENKDRGTFQYENDNAEYLTSYISIPILNGKIFTQVPLSEVNQGVSRISNIIIYMGIAVLIILIGVLYFVFKNYLMNPLQNSVEYTQEIANGNLKLEELKDSNDEIGLLNRNLNKMRISIKNLVSEIEDTSEMVLESSENLSSHSEEMSASTEEVSTAIQEVASGAEEQSAQIDETEDILNNLIESIEITKEMADEIDSTSDSVISNLNKGDDSISSSIRTIEKVKGYSDEVSETIYDLGELSEEIGEIIEMINSIADQTNLLALNAAIEAARAGEAGRGFSVVADEIRELAEESASATNNISELIAKIQTKVNNTVEKMNTTEEAVDESVGVIKDTRNVFSDIKNSSQELKKLIEQIDSQTDEMNKFSNKVEKNVNEISKVSQESASNAEEVAASSEEQTAAVQEIADSAEELAKIANELASKINKFNI
ncbi:MAG TPA: methyl-accepting chemotaxis protein [Halanaerobiales bacterium]|nr:methyl-accepting chemotaxis protein [Halanaerobiales bacterium]